MYYVTFSGSNHFHNALNLDVFLTWKVFFHSTFTWSWSSNANQSVNKLCNVVQDQIIWRVPNYRKALVEESSHQQLEY